MTKTPIKIATLEDYLNFNDGTDKRYELIVCQTFPQLTLNTQQVLSA